MTDEEKARDVAHAWIRDDASTGIKMMLTVEGCDELIKRIAVALKEAQERGYKQGVEATRLNLAEKEALRGLQND
jgi:hypothetical protein